MAIPAARDGATTAPERATAALAGGAAAGIALRTHGPPDPRPGIQAPASSPATAAPPASIRLQPLLKPHKPRLRRSPHQLPSAFQTPVLRQLSLQQRKARRLLQDLGELWQQILAGLELPSTRMLLSQQAELVRLDNHRAVVQVAGNWMGMVQSRVALLEQAIARAVGGNRQLVLESHGGAAPMAAMPTPSTPPAPPTPRPAPVPAPAVRNNEAELPPRPVAATPAATTGCSCPSRSRVRRLPQGRSPNPQPFSDKNRPYWMTRPSAWLISSTVRF